MAEEMIETAPWESDEAEPWESDEAIEEAEDSAEDSGERARRRQQSGNAWGRGMPPRKPFFPGYRGVVLSTKEGKKRLQFPKSVAAAEDLSGVANRSVIADRSLQKQVDQLRAKVLRDESNNSAVFGAVTLLIGGGLTAFGVIQANTQDIKKRSTGSGLTDWAGLEVTRIAAVTSAAQIATSGAKLAFDGQYRRGLSMFADAYAIAQLAAFAFGSLHTPAPDSAVVQEVPDLTKLNAAELENGTLIFDTTSNKLNVVVAGTFVQVSPS